MQWAAKLGEWLAFGVVLALWLCAAPLLLAFVVLLA